MSKAFTRESDDSGGDEVHIARRQLPPGTRNYITREGADRLRLKLEDLLEQRRSGKSATSEAVPAADALPRKLDVAIHKLQQILSSVVVAETPIDPEKVAFGSKVVIRRGGGEEENYLIVGVVEAEPENGSISWLSPLAHALLSRRAGEQVRFRDEVLTILSVK